MASAVASTQRKGNKKNSLGLPGLAGLKGQSAADLTAAASPATQKQVEDLVRAVSEIVFSHSNAVQQ